LEERARESKREREKKRDFFFLNDNELAEEEIED
jgi:hypothetical protein